MEEWRFDGNLNAAVNASSNGVGAGYKFGTQQVQPIVDEPGQACIAVGSYAGNGTNGRHVSVGFRPDLVIIRASNWYTELVFWNRIIWHGRSNRWSAGDSQLGVIEGVYDDGFIISSSPEANASKLEYTYLAIKDNGSKCLAMTSWMGDQRRGRSINFTDRACELVMIKRDSTRPSIWAGPDLLPSITGNGQGLSPAVEAVTANGVRLTDSVQVNENCGGCYLGEGIELVGFNQTSGLEIVKWTGDGTTGRVIPTRSAPNAIVLIRDDGGIPIAFQTDGSRGRTLSVNQGDPVHGQISLTQSGIVSDGSIYNALGQKYRAIVFTRSLSRSMRNRVITTSSFVDLTGDRSSLNLGSNAALSLPGAMSVEWWGIPDFELGGNQAVNLIMRMAGDSTVYAEGAGTASWGLFVYPPLDYKWRGHSLRVVQTDYLAQTINERNINLCSWNTGIRINPGEPIHLIATHDGAGHWQVFMNGQKVKDRKIDMTMEDGRRNGGRPNVRLPIVVGGRMNRSNQIVESSTMRVYGARVYNHELTTGQVIARWSDVTK